MTLAHRQRIITALVLVPLLAAAVLAGGMPLRLVASLVVAAALGEFLALFWELRQRPLAVVLTLGLGIGILWLPTTWPEALTLPLLTLGAGLIFLLHPHHDTTAAQTTAVGLVGILYVPILLRPGLTLSPLDLGFVLLATITTDTAAFYAGTHWGGPKLWPRVSPKKTWSGSLGGLAATIGVCTAYAVWGGNAPGSRAATVAIAVSVAAQMGDLVESALKRWRGVKDSGVLLPGHGGVLDRIDSLLFALPTYAFLTHLLPLWE